MRRWIFLWGWVVAGLSAAEIGMLTMPSAQADIVSVSSSDVWLNVARGTRTQRYQLAYNVSVTDLGAKALGGPVRFVVDAITGGVGEVDAPSGMTDDGKPYLTLLATGELTTGTTSPAVPFRINTTQRVGFTWHVEADMPLPTVAFAAPNQASAVENGSMIATVQLSEPSAVDVTVPYTLGGTASRPDDYDILSPNPLVIPAGNLSADIEIAIHDDTTPEIDEIVVLTLGAPTNAMAGAATTHMAVITDDDVARIGPDGGTVTAGNGSIVLDVPQGALGAVTEIRATPLTVSELPRPPEEHQVFIAAVQFEPDGLTFAQPATMTFALPQAMTPATPIQLRVYDPDNDVFTVENEALVNPDGSTASVKISHFSIYWANFVDDRCDFVPEYPDPSPIAPPAGVPVYFQWVCSGNVIAKDWDINTTYTCTNRGNDFRVVNDVATWIEGNNCLNSELTQMAYYARNIVNPAASTLRISQYTKGIPQIYPFGRWFGKDYAWWQITEQPLPNEYTFGWYSNSITNPDAQPRVVAPQTGVIGTSHVILSLDTLVWDQVNNAPLGGYPICGPYLSTSSGIFSNNIPSPDPCPHRIAPYGLGLGTVYYKTFPQEGLDLIVWLEVNGAWYSNSVTAPGDPRLVTQYPGYGESIPWFSWKYGFGFWAVYDAVLDKVSYWCNSLVDPGSPQPVDFGQFPLPSTCVGAGIQSRVNYELTLENDDPPHPSTDDASATLGCPYHPNAGIPPESTWVIQTNPQRLPDATLRLFTSDEGSEVLDGTLDPDTGTFRFEIQSLPEPDDQGTLAQYSQFVEVIEGTLDQDSGTLTGMHTVRDTYGWERDNATVSCRRYFSVKGPFVVVEN